MKVCIVKYNAGNIYSVRNSLRRAGVEPVLTDNAEELLSADKVIFPGQGEAATTMAYIRQRRLDEVIKALRQPVLGICIGQQLLCQKSEEGETECIGVFPVSVRRFRPQRHEDKVPAIGWNSINVCEPRADQGKELFRGLGSEPFVYFVHSYYVPLCQYTIATACYTRPFSAALCKDNFYSVQFHPEKSGAVGERIIRNFLSM